MEEAQFYASLSPQVKSKEVIVKAERRGKVLLNGMNTVAVISFLLLLLISFSLDHYWSLMNTMQIFVFYSLFDVTLTAPVAIFFKYLIKIATFEIIEMGDYYTEWFEYQDSDPFSKRFEILSFDSTSFLVTLGFMALVLAQIIASYIVWAFLSMWPSRLLHKRLFSLR